MDFGLNRQIYYFHTQKSLERFIEQFKDTLFGREELLYNTTNRVKAGQNNENII